MTRVARFVACAVLCLAATACPSQQEEALHSAEQKRDAILSEEKLYSQFNEELIIRHFFNDKQGGFFVDVGAADFERRSTTYYLEKKLGWSGIAIDALDEFRAGYEQNRPGTKFFSYIVTDHAGAKAPFYRIEGMLPNSSANKEYAEHWAVFAKRAGGTGATGKPAVLEVPTITLTQLLEENGVKRIDFLSMDIEGGEPPALRGFEIDRFQPALICIEAHPSVRQAIGDYMQAHRYERIDRYLELDKLNWYYQPVAHKALD